MKEKRLYFSVGLCTALISALFLGFVQKWSGDARLTALLLGYACVLCGIGGMLIFLLRKKIILFTEELCSMLDSMMRGQDIDLEGSKLLVEETLLSRIAQRLRRLYEVLGESRRRIAVEKQELQELVSDISHQVKTPVTNSKMIVETLQSRELTDADRAEFLAALDGQLDKLDFLMQSMVKSSRLETGIITLIKQRNSVHETLAAALDGIFMEAERREIRIQVDCDPGLHVPHDKKWTAEALFNILDNGVKYTQAGGNIRVSVKRLEMYTEIDIEDDGRGIEESKFGMIFQRFYREEAVHDISGIGIGLYLAREIITRQGGYIKVWSEIGAGSVFSVFLPNGSEQSVAEIQMSQDCHN